MVTRKPTRKDLFAEAAQTWDLNRIYELFNEAKRRIFPNARQGLTDTEKLYLRGLLCNCSPSDIARQLSKSARGAEVYMCKTLYQYFKGIPETPSDDVGNWRNVHQWLDKAGYKVDLSGDSTVGRSLPKDAKIHITDMNFFNDSENNNTTISIDINIKLSFPSDVKSQGEDEIAND
ncbi:DNA-binding response regulator [Microcoleus anatoxicus]|uniref:DNA-binding response regulator n=1 Tax=Microcoleus anatoxicus TaxID=2705319 RepID=UPI0030C8D89F